jgi:gliding motility-associated-like protein
MVGGVSYSNDKDVTGAKGDGDFWTVKLTSTGSINWQQNWGGTSNDHMRCMARNGGTGEYYLAGDSESSDGDFNNALGDADFGVIKFKELKITSADSVVCSVDGFIPFRDTLSDACGYDSAIVDYRPVPLGGPFDNGRSRDTIFIGQSVTLQPTANGTVTWDPHATLSCTQCQAPIASPFITTTYVATNAAADDCEVKGEFTVVVLNDAVIKMPTGFTPNGDGRNDLYGALGKVPEGYKLQIYNRDGEIVFKSNEIYSKWNGHFKGGVQPPGVFVYVVTYKDLKNVIHQQKGTLLLIR